MMKRDSLLAWLRLLRPPNLPTVPGDPLAGALLASALTKQDPAIGPAALCVGSSLLLYISGLIWNDCADIDEDTRDRPERPIPSGNVGRRAAFVVAGVLATAGMALAALAGPASLTVAAVLLSMILFYNFVARRFAVLGILIMGLCRGLSFLVGAASVGCTAALAAPILGAAMGIALYIAALSSIAFSETRSVSLGLRRYLPAAALLVCAGTLFAIPAAVTCATAGLALVAVSLAIVQGHRLAGTPAPPVVGAAVGSFIRTLILVQAMFCAAAGKTGTIVAAGLLLLLPISILLSRRYYAS